MSPRKLDARIATSTTATWNRYGRKKARIRRIVRPRRSGGTRSSPMGTRRPGGAPLAARKAPRPRKLIGSSRAESGRASGGRYHRWAAGRCGGNQRVARGPVPPSASPRGAGFAHICVRRLQEKSSRSGAATARRERASKSRLPTSAGSTCHRTAPRRLFERNGGKRQRYQLPDARVRGSGRPAPPGLGARLPRSRRLDLRDALRFEPALGVDGGPAAVAGGRDGLAIAMVVDVTGDEDALDLRCRSGRGPRGSPSGRPRASRGRPRCWAGSRWR